MIRRILLMNINFILQSLHSVLRAWIKEEPRQSSYVIQINVGQIIYFSPSRGFPHYILDDWSFIYYFIWGSYLVCTTQRILTDPRCFEHDLKIAFLFRILNVFWKTAIKCADSVFVKCLTPFNAYPVGCALWFISRCVYIHALIENNCWVM